MLLAQKRPRGIAEELYRNKTGQQLIAEGLWVCNLSSGDVGFYVYVARNEAFGKGNAIIYHEVLDGNESGVLYLSLSGLELFDSNIAIGVGTSTSKTLNFTLIGSSRENRNPRLW